VVVPAGEFITGTLNLGRASLYLEKGAVLKGSADSQDYRTVGFKHNEMGDTRSLLYSLHNHDIRISGEGTIDLNGDHFYHMDQPNIPPTLVPMNEKQKAECTRLFNKQNPRPNQPIFFFDCQRVRVQDIRIINAPCWTMSFVECQDVRVIGLTIDNDLRIPNNDGMHFCSCKNIFIRGCNISSADDCISITAITDWDKPSEDFVISDCIMRSCSKALVVGYMHSIVRNVCISNCIIKESNRAFCIMASSQTGLVENVQLSNVRLDTSVRAGYWWGNGEAICLMGVHHHLNYARPAPDRNFPVNIRNIRFQNIICTTENALGIVGEGDNVRDVHFNGLSVGLKDSDNLPLKGRMIDLSPGEQTASLPDDNQPYWLHLQSVQDVTVENAFIAPFHGQQPKVSKVNCKDLAIHAVNR
jgi:polygalacturonase